MVDVISNSSPLILLASIGRTNYIFSLYENIIIPPEVFKEVISKGLEKGSIDAIHLEKLHKEGKIKIRKPKKIDENLLNNKRLHLGEIEAISLALENQEVTILLDDDEARINARRMGLTVKGTLGLLVENYKKKFIARDEAKGSLKNLNELMYLSGDVYEFILQKLDE